MLQENMKKVGIILITLLILISFSTTINALELKEADTTYFKTLKVNDAVKSEAVFSLDTKTILTKDALTFTFNEVCGKVIDYRVLRKSICLFEKQTPIYKDKEICFYTPNNDSNDCYTEKTLLGYDNDTYYDICYEPFDSINDYSQDYKISANIMMELCSDGSYGYKVDWIPSIRIEDTFYEKGEWAWWNATGGSIITDGNYTVHTFTTNGTFSVPSGTMNATVLVVAGGGGGGWFAGGGGGAGGLIYTNSYSATGNITVVVGSGGTGATGAGNGNPGYNSSFGTLVSAGGGYGGKYDGGNGGSGGGGGGGDAAFPGQAGGTGVVGQGHDGGSSQSGAVSGGGGGGANTSGSNGASSSGGAGGYGSNYSISGNISCYAGGGGGSGTAEEGNGTCGGGHGGEQTPLVVATNALANTGSGGGGGYVETAGNGGSGIVIVRYLTEMPIANNTYLTVDLNTPVNDSWTNDDTPVFSWLPISNNVASGINCTFNYTLLGVSSTINRYNLNNNSVYNYTSFPLDDGEGSWFVNCSDGTNATTSSSYTLTVLTVSPTISYFNIEGTTFYTNTSLNTNISTTVSLGSLSADIDCYVNLTTLILSEDDIGLTNNTNYDFTTIGYGNFSKNDNVSCNVTVLDNATNTANSSDYVIISDTRPSVPTDINFSSSAFYYNYNTSFTANGSTDIDNDTITYHYQVYNLNDSILRQEYSSLASYIPVLADSGDTLRVSAKATTTDANSSTTYNETLIAYLTSATLNIRREKDNSLFDMSNVDDLILSIICSDDVEEVNLTLNVTTINISCAYEYLKLDYDYGNESYFRIITPTYEAFSNITFYLLDLTVDTAVEIIININDLSGEYSSGTISIDRYINGTQVNIISQPFDIENSATLYLLRNALYSVTVTNNDGDSRVIGNLISSEAGEKTLTLPEINFYPDEIIVGNQLLWNYTYGNTAGNSFIELNYYDGIGGSSNITYSIYNSSEDRIFRTSLMRTTNLTTGTVTITLNPLPNNNITYFSLLEITHDSFSYIIKDYAIFVSNGTILVGDWIGGNFVEDDFKTKITDTLFWIGLIAIFIIGLVFDAQNSKIGLVAVMFFMLMFIAFGFIQFGGITGVVTSVIGVVIVFNFITKSRRDTGGD